MSAMLVKQIIFYILFISIFFNLAIPFDICFAEGDPFGTPQLGTSPNCGPETRSKLDTTLNSTNDFVSLLKSRQEDINAKLGYSWKYNWDRMISFKNPDASINWADIEKNIKKENINGKTVYSLRFNVENCSFHQFHTLKVTSTGDLSLYGCCGK